MKLLLLHAVMPPVGWRVHGCSCLGKQSSAPGTSSDRPSSAVGPGADVTSAVQQPSTEAINAAIAAQATAAVEAGKAAEFLVVFRTREDAVASRAQAISTAAGLETSTEQTLATARRQEFRAVKARVLEATTAPSASATEAGPQQATTSPAIQVTADFKNLPITAVSISSAAQLARLQADPDVLSVQANGVVQVASAAAWAQIGQPLAAARGYTGSGTVVVIDTGLDYTRPAFGPCTVPGVPAATCKVVYAADMVADDGALDSAGKSSGHGTNVAGIIACEWTSAAALTAVTHAPCPLHRSRLAAVARLPATHIL